LAAMTARRHGVPSGTPFPAKTRQKEASESFSGAVRCSCVREEGERWSGGARPAAQCALVNRAEVRRAIAATVSLAKAYQDEHSTRGVVVELWRRPRGRRRALEAVNANSGEAERWLAVLLRGERGRRKWGEREAERGAGRFGERGAGARAIGTPGAGRSRTPTATGRPSPATVGCGHGRSRERARWSGRERRQARTTRGVG
jgi:hypothetical protein